MARGCGEKTAAIGCGCSVSGQLRAAQPRWLRRAGRMPACPVLPCRSSRSSARPAAAACQRGASNPRGKPYFRHLAAALCDKKAIKNEKGGGSSLEGLPQHGAARLLPSRAGGDTQCPAQGLGHPVSPTTAQSPSARAHLGLHPSPSTSFLKLENQRFEARESS